MLVSIVVVSISATITFPATSSARLIVNEESANNPTSALGTTYSKVKVVASTFAPFCIVQPGAFAPDSTTVGITNGSISSLNTKVIVFVNPLSVNKKSVSSILTKVGLIVSISKVSSTLVSSTFPETSVAPELETVTTAVSSSASTTLNVSVQIVFPPLHAPAPALAIAPVFPAKAIVGLEAGFIASS